MISKSEYDELKNKYDEQVEKNLSITNKVKELVKKFKLCQVLIY